MRRLQAVIPTLVQHFYTDGTPMSKSDERWYNILGDTGYVGIILIGITLIYMAALLITGS